MTPDASPGAGNITADGLPRWIDPARTALVVIDIQVDFAAPEGLLGRAGVDVSVLKPALARAGLLVDEARRTGVPVIFVALQTSPETDSPSWKEWMRRRGRMPDEEMAICRIGTPGVEFCDPKPREGELVVGKPKYSAFIGTDFEAQLRARGVDTLVVCGITTECCVDCTVRDAFHRDFHVFLVEDACAAYEEEVHQGSLRALTLNCAIPVTTSEVEAAWGELAVPAGLKAGAGA